jgi:hypothetical protein
MMMTKHSDEKEAQLVLEQTPDSLSPQDLLAKWKYDGEDDEHECHAHCGATHR